MQVEQPFVEFNLVEAPLELLDPFASLTAAEIVYLAWTLSAHRALTLGASVPPPPSLTPMMRLKKKTMAMMVTVTMRARATSSSCY
jgi:hypothetical protein